MPNAICTFRVCPHRDKSWPVVRYKTKIINFVSLQAGLQPRDAVLLVWEVRGMDDPNRALKKVITEYKDYIETATKGPIVERAKVNDFGGVIVKEDQKVKWRGY